MGTMKRVKHARVQAGLIKQLEQIKPKTQSVSVKELLEQSGYEIIPNSTELYESGKYIIVADSKEIVRYGLKQLVKRERFGKNIILYIFNGYVAVKDEEDVLKSFYQKRSI